MAENNRLILKTPEQELLTPRNYKVVPSLLENPLWPSLDNQGSLNDLFHPTSSTKLEIHKVVGIYYEGEEKSISELNNQIIIDDINDLRNISGSVYTNVLVTPDTTLESLPEHPHILEQIENLERMETEYSSKLNMLDYLVDSLFDTGYATNMYMIGLDINNPVEPDTDGRIYDTNVRTSGYIKIEKADPDIVVNYVFRGIPVPMRKTLTSENVINNTETKNYIFTYPQYLLDNIDLIQAIQYIEVLSPGTKAVIYYGDSYDFLLSTNSTTSPYSLPGLEGFAGDLANLHIVNKAGRNLNSEVETEN